MKKALAMILSLVFVLTGVGVAFAIAAPGGETPQTVSGLQEKMDALWLKNHFTEEEIAKMNQEYVDYQTNNFWESQLPFMEMSGRWHTESHDPEEELAWYLNFVRLDFNSAILATALTTDHYAYQYAEAGNFGYLFSSLRYWVVPFADEPRSTAKYLEDGRHTTDTNVISFWSYQFNMGREGWDFLKDTNQIEQLLLEKGETSVSDVKVFTGMFTFLYLKCDKEYLVFLDGGSSKIPNIDRFKLYTATEVMESMLIVEKENTGRNEVYGATKPMYTAEAEALQAQGLFNGNEKGLDLLKPLTRIEASAMLLRAIGESEAAPNPSLQTFSDVPAAHWGYGAAEKAASIGLVKGVGDGQFAPDKTVKATEFATMTLRAADVEDFDWQQAVSMLIDRGIITEEESKTMDLFTRGDMAKIVYEAREKGLLH